jgi:inorganic pyrophosphatase
VLGAAGMLLVMRGASALMHPIAKLSPFASPGIVNAIIESPAGATSKIKWDPEHEIFTWSRPLPLGIAYPHHWGFVAGTRAEDGDPLDILVLSEGTTFSGLLVCVRPIGVLRVEQNAEKAGRERNDRLIAIPENAPRSEISSADDLPARTRREIERFFLDVTFFEDKDTKLLGWDGPHAALRAVKDATTRVRSKRSKKAR